MGLFDLGVDWSEVEAPEFSNVPEGNYVAVLSAIDNSVNDKGVHSIVFDYLITEDDANDGRYVGRTVKEWQRYKDESGILDSIRYLKARLINLGVPENYDISNLDPEDILDTEVAITIKKRNVNGTDYFNVTRVEKIDGSVSSDPTDYDDDSATAKVAQQKKARDTSNPFA